MLKWEKRKWRVCADCLLVVFQMQRYNIRKAVCHLLSFSIVKMQEKGLRKVLHINILHTLKTLKKNDTIC